MAFEIFKDTGIKSKEFISVTETKAFGISRAFIDKHNITTDHKVVIIYDQDTNRVALHFATDAPKIGFSIRIPHPKHGGTISAKTFFDTKKIDTRLYAGRYDDFEKVSLRTLGIDRSGGAFVVSLKESRQKHISDEINSHDTISSVDGDEPINLDDIPF